jgi:phenylalanyl-tRNA synthetase alpha chain
MSQNAFDKAKELMEEIKTFIISDKENLELFRKKFVGSKNIIKPLFSEIKNIPNEQKREFGQFLNQLKQEAESRFNIEKEKIEENVSANKLEDIDLSRPSDPVRLGARHPISIVNNRIIEIFEKLGFTVAEDREIEDDWHNFTAMNTPEDHPARDMQDTFYLKDSVERLLRTHTSSVQSRVMTSTKPPIRIIAPGRVYRNETISARSHAQFHQVEGLYIDEGVSFADLKQTLLYFAQEMYGKDTKIRLRPSYFPFTEPSAEMDVYWGLNDEIDYRITKGTGWLEILGCGMVDPNVLENCDIDSEKYTGFAFGMGIERQAMLLHRIDDIRAFFENDIRFLEQFKSVF